MRRPSLYLPVALVAVGALALSAALSGGGGIGSRTAQRAELPEMLVVPSAGSFAESFEQPVTEHDGPAGGTPSAETVAAVEAAREGMPRLSAGTALAFFASAPAVVVCDGGEESVQRGTEIAVAAGAPLLCGAELTDFTPTIRALGSEYVLSVGDADTTTLAAALSDATGTTIHQVPAGGDAQLVSSGRLVDGVPPLRGARGGQGKNSALVLALADLESAPARATAQAAGAQVATVPASDPRATSESVELIQQAEGRTLIALGSSFGATEDLAWKRATAETGPELPAGGQLVAPGKTYIALYGTPGTPSLGVLGEQGVEATIERAAQTAAEYSELLGTPVVPTLEIIASIASRGPGPEGTYSNVQPVEMLRPLVDAAAEAGQYVVLDLQPGRQDFLTQAKYYEELLREPHVGLALDPEWRLKPHQVHLRQIGQVEVAEVNEVVTWLADLTRENLLPQKFLVLHSFQNRMIVGLDYVDQSRDELAVLVHVDGQGPQGAKQDTWRRLREYAPSVQYWGWKNFLDEDAPMLTPQQTVEQVSPAPVFVSYQ